jgi:hypothetical protein
MSGINTDVNQRYYNVGKLEVVNGKIKVVYTDSDNTNAPFAVYRVSFYVRGEKEGEA